MTALDRRNFLTAMASVAAGAGLLGASKLRAWTAPASRGLAGDPAPCDCHHRRGWHDLVPQGLGRREAHCLRRRLVLELRLLGVPDDLAPPARPALRRIRPARTRPLRSPGHGYDFDTLSADLAAVLEGLDLRDTILVGHSAGNGEIVRYLSRYGNGRIAGAVLVAPALPFLLKTTDNPDGIDRSVFEAIRTAMARDRPRWLAEGTPPFFGGPGAVSEERMRWGVSLGLQTSLQAALEFHRAFTETDFRSELQAIEVPILVIHGDRDTSAPLEMTGRKIAARIPRARLEVYEGAAHGLPITHADRLNADLVAFANDRR